MNIIETYDLSKSYGRMVALDQVNLAASAGAILGVVGAKGSGKTTLLRVLATLSTPTAGDALIAGSSILGSPSRIRRIIGYMPQHFGIYLDMTVDEYLHFFAESYAVPHAEQTQLISDLLALTDLSHHRDELLGRLSQGMHQRLNLARALAHDPQVLLMDEPISGADPRAHVEMRELIKELRNMGKTVVITAPIVAGCRQSVYGYRHSGSGARHSLRPLLGRVLTFASPSHHRTEILRKRSAGPLHPTHLSGYTGYIGLSLRQPHPPPSTPHRPRARHRPL